MYRERGKGKRKEIENRLMVAEELCAMVEKGMHNAAAVFAFRHGIRNSLLQGGKGYPSLMGAHFDYILSVFPNRSAFLREAILHRRETGWKKTDRAPKMPAAGPEEMLAEEPTEDEVEETDPPDSA
jgi:hypothetical protein